MRILKYTLLAIIPFLLFACGDSDDGICEQDDWIGTYTGTELCNGEELPATVVLTSSGAGYTMSIDNGGVSLEIDGVATIDNCTSSLQDATQAAQSTLSIQSTLDGDNLVMNTDFFGSTCTYTLTRR